MAKKAKSEDDSFGYSYPQLLEEWDWKNNEYDPFSLKKFSNLENPVQTFNQRVAQLNVLKLEGKLPSNKDATQFKTYKNIEIGLIL